MLLLRLWNYIRGYVIILVEGFFLEKFINICIHRQILLWDIKRGNNGVMTLKVSIKAFKMLRPIAGKTNCRVRILKKSGLPFIIHRYRKRKAFVVGAAVFVVLLYVLTSFIWTIEITGNKNIEVQTIVDNLALHGVKPGVLKYTVNTDEIVNALIIDMKELAWVGVEVKGTKVKIEIAEGVKPPAIIPKDAPCDITAQRDGLIKSVVAKIGQQMVKPGDTVTRGQVLISGTIISENKDVPPKLVHATGQVKARTWYEISFPVKDIIEETERTGNFKENYSLMLFTKRIDLFHKKNPFEQSEKVEIKKKISLGEDIVLPFELIIDRYYENKIIEREIDIEDAKKIAVDAAYKEISAEISEDAEIVEKKIDFIEQDEDGLEANIVIECLENIEVTKAIGGN